MQASFAKTRVLLLLSLSCIALVSILNLLAAMTRPAQAASAATNVGGSIITDTIWTAANSPYILTQTVTIQPNVTLTVEPGVTVIANQYAGLGVLGTLQAIGTPSDTITFTSIISQLWSGMWVEGGSAYINYAIIENTYSLNIGNSEVPDGPVVIENSTFRNLHQYPIYIGSGSLHLLQMNNVTFENNDPSRVYITPLAGSYVLAGNTTLSAHSGLEGYEIHNASFVIPAGLTLTLQSGTTLFLEGVMPVAGHLEAVGTADSPVTFTSIEDTGPGQWASIVLVEGSAHLNHTIVRYAGEYKGGIMVGDLANGAPGGELWLENSYVGDNSGEGLTVEAGQVTAVCSIISNNQGDGVHVDSSGNISATIAGSTIANNDGEGLNNENLAQVDARFNYWGTADGPGGQGSGSGDEVSGNVLYTPWLPQPACDLSAFVDLETHKTAAVEIILAGSPLTYTVTITNHSSTTATAVILTDTLPLSVTLTALPANCTGVTALTCDLDDLPGGNSTSLSYSVMVSETAVGLITNTVSVASGQTDFTPVNNRDVVEVMAVTVPTVSFIQPDFFVSEAANTAVISLTTDIFPVLTATVNYATIGGTAIPGKDYTPVSGTLTFIPGETEQVFAIPLLDDTALDGDKIINLVLSDPQEAILGLDMATLTIVDDETTPSIDLEIAKTASAEAILAGRLLTYTVTITNHSSTTATTVMLTGTLPLSVTLTTLPPNCADTTGLTCNLGNIPGNDSISLSYSVMVSTTAVGLITNTASISADQPDPNPTNNSAWAVVTAGPWPTLSFSMAETVVDESAKTAVISLSLDIAPIFTVTAHYAAEGGTAIPNQDYLPVSGTLTFAPGISQQTFVVPLMDDTLLDGDKTANLLLADIENGLLGVATAVLTIQDNEEGFSIYLPAISKK